MPRRTPMASAASARSSCRTWARPRRCRASRSRRWAAPIVVQSGTATGVTLKWFRFSDGSLVTTQTLTMTPGSALRVDPKTVSALADDTQYSVVATGVGGTINAIVIEQASSGDNAMIYEGFAGP